jgi:hypothetical protein
MRDLPHHMKKLNRRVVRSEHRIAETEEIEELLETPQIIRPREQTRKQHKELMRQQVKAHVPQHPSEEERNRQMKHRVPVFDRLSNPKPKVGAKPKKKSPKY